MSNVAALSTASARAESLSMYAFLDEFDSRPHNICFYLNLYAFLSLLVLLFPGTKLFCCVLPASKKYVYGDDDDDVCYESRLTACSYSFARYSKLSTCVIAPHRLFGTFVKTG